MAIWNLGSVNIDHVYTLPHFPAPGETLSSTGYDSGLGGKGANQSVAAAQAGAKVWHMGAIGHDGLWAREVLELKGVDLEHLEIVDVPTGHAVIYVDGSGENSIVIFPGANHAVSVEALDKASPEDWLLLQNETTLVTEAAKAAKDAGLKVAYVAAPFEAEAAQAVLPHVDLLMVNEGEAAALAEAVGKDPLDLPVPMLLITYGAKGATFRGPEGSIETPAFHVKPVDTTGAGDTFSGYFLAALDLGAAPAEALRRASAAAALQVTRHGAVEAIPSAAEVDDFLKENA
ncbi:ribokinase [Paracoccaceae bacterium GXU_MW_L88]